MSAPIKPPGLSPASKAAEEAADVSPQGRLQGGAQASVERLAGQRFERVAEGIEAQDAQGAQGAQGAERASPADALDRLDRALGAGEIEASEAVDRLVAHALEVAKGLSPARRVELEALLRASLATDPTLLSLQRELALSE